MSTNLSALQSLAQTVSAQLAAFAHVYQRLEQHFHQILGALNSAEALIRQHAALIDLHSEQLSRHEQVLSAYHRQLQIYEERLQELERRRTSLFRFGGGNRSGPQGHQQPQGGANLGASPQDAPPSYDGTGGSWAYPQGRA